MYDWWFLMPEYGKACIFACLSTSNYQMHEYYNTSYLIESGSLCMYMNADNTETTIYISTIQISISDWNRLFIVWITCL